MLVELVADTLYSPTYPASLAGLFWNMNTTEEGIHIGVGGYNDKLPVLLKTVVDALVNYDNEFKQEKFNIFRDGVRMEISEEIRCLASCP